LYLIRDVLGVLENFLTADGDYSILDSLIKVMDVVLAQSNFVESDRQALSDEEITGMIYTLGKFLTYYDTEENEWVYQGDPKFDVLLKLSRDDLLRMHEIINDSSRENYKEFAYYDVKVLMEALMKEDGLIESVMDSLEYSTGADSWEEVINDIHELLLDDALTGSGSLWTTLSDLMTNMLEVIEKDVESGGGSGDSGEEVMDNDDVQKYKDFFEEYGFQFNG